jgi:cell division protein FtsN
VSPQRHFEIIISGRQLAGVIALVAALLLVTFGLGVGVGLLEPRAGRSLARQETAWQAMPVATMPADRESPASVPTAAPAPPGPAAALTGEVVAPPMLPADILNATPPAVAVPGPESGTPGSDLQATPTPRPPRPTPTARPRPTATPQPTAPPQFWIQAGALTHADQAEGVRQRVIALGFSADQVVVLAGTGGKYRVRLGPFPDQESADRVEARLKVQGFPDAYRLRE